MCNFPFILISQVEFCNAIYGVITIDLKVEYYSQQLAKI
jgi:hypothetical protein